MIHQEITLVAAFNKFWNNYLTRERQIRVIPNKGASDLTVMGARSEIGDSNPGLICGVIFRTNAHVKGMNPVIPPSGYG